MLFTRPPIIHSFVRAFGAATASNTFYMQRLCLTEFLYISYKPLRKVKCLYAFIVVVKEFTAIYHLNTLFKNNFLSLSFFRFFYANDKNKIIITTTHNTEKCKNTKIQNLQKINLNSYSKISNRKKIKKQKKT